MIENLIKERLDSLGSQYTKTDIFVLAHRVKKLASVYTNSTFKEIVEAIIPDEKMHLKT